MGSKNQSGRVFKNDAPTLCPYVRVRLPNPRRHRPNRADHPLQPHLPAQRPGQRPHHRRPGEEQAHEDRHQPLPAVAVRQRPDIVSRLHPLHPHSQPHEGLHLRSRHV